MTLPIDRGTQCTMGTAGPLPALLQAPPGWRCIDFISDLHLSAATPRAFEAWRRYLETTRADAVFILGDLFDAWIGDDARHAGFEAEATAALRAAAARCWLGFMVGNRDFLVGAEMCAASGLNALADPTVLQAFDQRVLLTHGDAWCLADTDYQRFRRQVRDAGWQRGVLARPLAERRAMAHALRSESERANDIAGTGADIDHPTAVAALCDADAATLVHGHTHRPTDEALAPGRWRRVLSDWALDDGGEPRAEVLRLTADGWRRLVPSAAADAAVVAPTVA